MHLNRTSLCLYFAVTHWSALAIYPSSTSPSEILDRHPPIKTKTLATCVRIPWFNADVQQWNCIHCKAERNPLKEVFPQIGLHIRKSSCNKYSALLKTTRTSYHSNLIGQCACDSRKLPKLVTFLCRDPSDGDLLPHNDPVPVTNKFGELPVEKVELIKDSFNNIQVNPPCSDTAAPAVKLDSFSPLSVEDVSNINSTSYNASCSLVLIPKWLVKSCLDILAPSIAQKVKLPTCHAYIPNDWKTAIVKALLEKNGLELTYKNFHPSFISDIHA